MSLLIEVIVGLLLALVVYIGIHYFIVTRLTKLLRQKTQRLVDQVTEVAVKQLKMLPEGIDLHSDYNAGVWGRGVMAFEYHIFSAATVEELREIKTNLERALNEYGKREELATLEDYCFAVTDMWLMDGKIYFDVAYLFNQVTVEYVEDLKRLDEK